MAKINTETTFEIELSEQEQKQIAEGEALAFSLPNGDSLRLSGEGVTGDPVLTDVETKKNAASGSGDKDTEELVNEIEQLNNKPVEADSQLDDGTGGGGGTDSDGNPAAGGLIDIERN